MALKLMILIDDKLKKKMVPESLNGFVMMHHELWPSQSSDISSTKHKQEILDQCVKQPSFTIIKSLALKITFQKLQFIPLVHNRPNQHQDIIKHLVLSSQHPKSPK